MGGLMDHQPFERWIFEVEMLSDEQANALRDHLQECERCRAMAEAWRAVEQEIILAPMVSPAPGFTHRWKARMSERRRIAERRQFVAFGVSILFGIAVVAGLMLMRFITQYQSSNVDLLTWLGEIVKIVEHLNLVRQIWGAVFSSMLSTVPLVYRVAIPTVLAGLSTLWFFSMARLGMIRVQKE
jgi:predicted anti-sigma-YlaC factor YlaD